MWLLLTAVLSSSLIGSTHCVGMCGPLAIWAGGASQRNSPRAVVIASSLYHLGRLITYAAVGLIAGGIGSLLDIGGSALGVQLLTAKVVGLLMLFFGIRQLLRLMQIKVLPPSQNVNTTSWLTQKIASLRPHIHKLPLAARGLATGLMTALLPCGWLYLFAMFAAGTGNSLSGVVVMTAFWLGTVPLLVALVATTHSLSSHFKRLIPAAAAIALIFTGASLFSGRGFASMNSLDEIVSSSSSGVPESQQHALPDSHATEGSTEQLVSQLDELSQVELPCCQQVP